MADHQIDKRANAYFEKARSIWGDRFEYDVSSFTSLASNIKFVDKETGIEITQNAGNHLRSLPKVLTAIANKDKNKSKFIEKSRRMHNNFYSYDNVVYDNTDIKVEITCPVHGSFYQTPHDHLNGHGCRLCWMDRRAPKPKEKIFKGRYHIGFDEFVSRATERFGERFSYNPSKYIDISSNTSITCHVHGEFTVAAYNHLKSESGGCPGCKDASRFMSSEEYISRVFDKRGDKIDLSKSVYTGYRDNITVVCSKHGEFTCMASYLLKSKHGCPMCGKEKILITKPIDNDEYISRISSKFPELDFSNSVYTGYINDVEFVCPTHGKQIRKAGTLNNGYGCKLCGNVMNKYEQEIYDYISSLIDSEIIIKHRPPFMNKMELDLFISEYNLAIEYNGIAFHHSSKFSPDKFYSSTAVDRHYHYNKWKLCHDEGVALISIPDFYWANDIKRNIIKSKIRHYLKLDNKIYARKCNIVEVDYSFAKDFYASTHIEGAGFNYPNSKSYALVYDNDVVMCVTIGDIYNQSSKETVTKVQRVSTKLDTTVVGGISKLISFLKEKYGSLKYQYTVEFGGSTFNLYDSVLIGPRYFWVNPISKEYYHRNYCQKGLLEKHFGEKLLDNDTESSYMERLGYLRYFDSGIFEIILK